MQSLLSSPFEAERQGTNRISFCRQQRFLLGRGFFLAQPRKYYPFQKSGAAYEAFFPGKYSGVPKCMSLTIIYHGLSCILSALNAASCSKGFFPTTKCYMRGCTWVISFSAKIRNEIAKKRGSRAREKHDEYYCTLIPSAFLYTFMKKDYIHYGIHFMSLRKWFSMMCLLLTYDLINLKFVVALVLEFKTWMIE